MLATPTWHSPLPSAWGPCTTRHTAIWCSGFGRCSAHAAHTVTPGHAVTERTERTVRTTVLAAMDVVGFCACTGARTRKRLRGAQRHQRAIAYR